MVLGLRLNFVSEGGIVCKRCSIISSTEMLGTTLRVHGVEVCNQSCVSANFCVLLDNVGLVQWGGTAPTHVKEKIAQTIDINER